MKLRNYVEVLGLRGRPRRYGTTLKTFALEGLPRPVRYAQWQHPKEQPKSVDPQEIRAYEKFLGKGDFCIDIGAHSGDSVLPIALAVGPQGLVLALEPNPYVYPVLERNARLNRGLVNIHPIMAAAAPADGFMTFEYSDSGFCNGGRHEDISKFRHGHAYELEVVTIDLARELQECFAAELPRLKFIKVDAEGYDFHVLKTLDDILRRHRPYIKAEVYGRSSQDYREGLMDFLAGYGYAVYKTHSDSDLAGTRMDRGDVMRFRHYDIFCVPGGA